ncbi:multicopper oxidase domain-containing protein [Granulosicoccus sp.]|nr:multicopper oxidase domain-containing protein [Granulosicoccus sp.]MDB4224703.1 multicopper oxidase domain-containing protein [Granulosicoccus sp.]
MHTRNSNPISKRRVFLKQAMALLTLPSMASLGALMGVSKIAQASGPKYVLNVQEINGQQLYNGVSPGPTFRVKAGDNLDVDLHNSLSPLHDDCTDTPNGLHGLNTTNLHTHGLHVSPTTDSTGEFDADNVFVSVVPEGQIVMCDDVCGSSTKTHFRWEKANYRFELGDNHPSGTFWYHAHKHGSTARQVGDGMAGPLIVQDRPGHLPEYIEKAPEKILMIMNKGIVLANPDGGGETDPVIKMRPGEVQRWRVINATGNGDQFLFLETNQPELEIYQIAYDGLTLNKRFRIDSENFNEPWLNPASLASGNRMDLIVRAPVDGTFDSENSLFKQIVNLIDLLGNSARTQLKVEIDGEPVNHSWSDDDALPGPGITPFDDKSLPQRSIAFTRQNSIDNEPFDGDVEQSMVLGTAEEWTVTNQTQAVHVYHIHVNPFFITHINGIELAENDPLRRWQDTLGLPITDGGEPASVTFKTRFEKFTGKFVIHCHVLRHEDNGMMQVVEIVEA